MARKGWVRGDQPPDQLIGWLISFGGPPLLLLEIREIASTGFDVEEWWSLLAASIPLVLFVMVFLGRLLPIGLVRAAWWWVVLGSGGLLLLSFVAYRGTTADEFVPWVWSFEPIAVCLVTLITRPSVSIAYGLISPFLPVLSGSLFAGSAPQAVVTLVPTHLGNVALVIIFLGLRARLSRLNEAEAVARADREREVAAEEWSRSREEFVRIVHDQVLSTLTAATRLPGSPPALLREEASRAVSTLSGMSEPSADGYCDSDTACAELIHVLRNAAPGAGIESSIGAGRVSLKAVRQIALALGEAARNSVRHTPLEAQRRARLTVIDNLIRAVFIDDGPGFDLAEVPAERIGLRLSIIGRMEEVGGIAVIHSGPTGTSVDLRWEG
ncbi:MAG: hypothetical protein QM628_03510 [Propionicimonas sp.]